MPLFTKQQIGSSPLKGCEGNCRPSGKQWQPTVGFMTHNTRRLTENAAGIPAGLQSRDTISDERLACPRLRLTNAARGDKTRSAAMRPSVKLLWTLACSSCRPAGRGRDADERRGVGSHGADAESSVSTAAGYSSPVDVRLHSVLCLANRSAPSSFGQ